MMQELLGEASVGLIGGGGIINASPSPSPSPSPSASYTSSAGATTTGTGTTATENLRCPRCDSSNTKFCYYNNYNLTQPRHFCKTCRRYWTKGGALRNVPIGGGCRKNKNTTITSAVGKSSHATAKLKTLPSDITKSSLFGGFDPPELPSNPIFWAASAQNSHLLSLFRSNQNPNPTHLPNLSSLTVKEEGTMFGSSHLSSERSISNIGPNSRSSGLETIGPMHVPSFGPMSNSFYRNQGIVLGEVRNSGLQDLYQRLRSLAAAGSCYPENAQVILGNVASASASASAILDSAPVASAELGFWNPAFSCWANDLSTTNGAYP